MASHGGFRNIAAPNPSNLRVATGSDKEIAPVVLYDTRRRPNADRIRDNTCTNSEGKDDGSIEVMRSTYGDGSSCNWVAKGLVLLPSGRESLSFRLYVKVV